MFNKLSDTVDHLARVVEKMDRSQDGLATVVDKMDRSHTSFKEMCNNILKRHFDETRRMESSLNAIVRKTIKKTKNK